MVLSGQSIRTLSRMISPFKERQVHAPTGMSWGLSVAGYDIRVAQAFELQPGRFELASSVERFVMPRSVLGQVADKSTLARKGIAVQNTIIEPGWKGFLTLEITNHGPEPVRFVAGQPIAQVIFHWLDKPAEKPYSGKYQNQPDYPVGALVEQTELDV